MINGLRLLYSLYDQAIDYIHTRSGSLHLYWYLEYICSTIITLILHHAPSSALGFYDHHSSYETIVRNASF